MKVKIYLYQSLASAIGTVLRKLHPDSKVTVAVKANGFKTVYFYVKDESQTRMVQSTAFEQRYITARQELVQQLKAERAQHVEGSVRYVFLSDVIELVEIIEYS